MAEPTTGRIRAPKTAELVARDLRRQIVRGELLPGAPLPTEADLMSVYGISRPTLREAFRVLEVEHLISIRRGARGGARVQAPSLEVAARYAGLLLQREQTPLAAVYHARLVVETAAVRLLLERGGNEQLAAVRAALAAQEAAVASAAEPLRLQEAGQRFHIAVVEACGNATLAVLAGLLADIVGHHERRVAGEVARDHAHDLGLDAHRKLVDLIEAKQASAAEQLWRDHLEGGAHVTIGASGDSVLVDVLD